MSTKIDQPEANPPGVPAGCGASPEGERSDLPAARRCWSSRGRCVTGWSDEVIDGLLAGARTEEEIVGPGGVLAQLTKRLVERALPGGVDPALGLSAAPGAAGAARVTPAMARWRRRL